MTPELGWFVAGRPPCQLYSDMLTHGDGRLPHKAQVYQSADGVRRGGGQQKVDDLLAVFLQQVVALVFVVSWQVVANLFQKLHYAFLGEDKMSGTRTC